MVFYYRRIFRFLSQDNIQDGYTDEFFVEFLGHILQSNLTTVIGLKGLDSRYMSVYFKFTYIGIKLLEYKMLALLNLSFDQEAQPMHFGHDLACFIISDLQSVPEHLRVL